MISKFRAPNVAEGRIADVGVFGNFAYLGAFAEPDCTRGGVYVVDITDPARPRDAGFIPTGQSNFVGEGVQVIHVDTPAFTGDILPFNNEICGPVTDTTVGGLTLVDVTDPRQPEFLAEGVGDFDPPSVTGAPIAHQIHSVFAWDAGDKAYVVIVDDEEAADVDIMDITDPRNPVLIAEYDLDVRFPQIIQPELGSASSFLHDMVVKRIGSRFVMLLSYWDGGYVAADVTDPTNLTYIADSDFTNPDPEAAESGFTVEPEGNAHQAEFSRDSRSIVAADEDFDPFGLKVTNTTDGTELPATQGNNTPPIDPDAPISADTVFVGRACPGDPAPPAGDGSQIAVVERGVCAFTEKVAAVETAGGYVAVVVMNREGPDACSDLLNMDVAGGIPAVFIGRDSGFALFDVPYDEAACRAGDGTVQAPIAIGTVGDSMSIESEFNGWGYVHLLRNGAGKLRELDTYAIPEAHDPRFAEGFGDLSVHEAATSAKVSNLTYYAYYAGGFRVTRTLNNRLVEAGAFIDQAGNNLWGVQVFESGGKEYVAASDRDFGLYIFEYVGPGRPNP